MKRWTGLVIAVFLFVSGCTSYSNTENAKSQIAFGARVARQGLWREAAFRFEQAIARDPNNARATLIDRNWNGDTRMTAGSG